MDGDESRKSDEISYAVAAIEPQLGTVEVDGGLGRHLGVYSTALLIVNSMVGTGIFSTPSSIITSVGSVGPALLLWAFGFVVAFCGLFIWLEWGSLYPRSGGEKVYLEVAYPKPRLLATTLFTVQAALLSSAATGCIAFAENFALAVGFEPGDLTKRIIAITALFCVTLVHSIVPRYGVKIMDFLAMLKIFMLGVIDILGLYILIFGISTVPDPMASFRDPFLGSSSSSYDYALALLKVLSTYYGWSYPAYVLNEVKDPVRTLKRAGPIGLGTVGVLYILANVAYFAAATPTEIGESGVTVAALFLGKVFGEGARRVAAGLVSLSALGYIMTNTFSHARIDQELAKEGMLPFATFWASNWPNGAPSAGLLLVFLVGFIQIVAIPFGDAYNFILDVLGYPTALMSLMVTLGLFLSRRRTPHVERPFKVWLPIACAFLISQVFLIVTPFIRPEGGKGDTHLPYWLAPFVAVIALFGGVLSWFVWRVVLPAAGNFTWIAYETILSDGTPVLTWKRSWKAPKKP
ncbi:amino acid/polyamine transporter I [Bisporella sp. PMI_857]|nr:amino acid/polyamine transporter I [Bisporella sp. PMI_857]